MKTQPALAATAIACSLLVGGCSASSDATLSAEAGPDIRSQGSGIYSRDDVEIGRLAAPIRIPLSPGIFFLPPQPADVAKSNPQDVWKQAGFFDSPAIRLDAPPTVELARFTNTNADDPSGKGGPLAEDRLVWVVVHRGLLDSERGRGPNADDRVEYLETGTFDGRGPSEIDRMVYIEVFDADTGAFLWGGGPPVQNVTFG